MHHQWATSQAASAAPFPSNYFSLPLPALPAPHAANAQAGPSTAPLPSPPSGSGSHPPSLDCSLCETPINPAGAAGAGLAFCCEEPQCLPLANDVCGPACPSTSFVGWDEMLLDDCKECAPGLDGSSTNHPAEGATSDPCCSPWPAGPNSTPFDSFTECCTEGCFDLPDLSMGTAGGPDGPTDDCAECWSAQGPPSIGGSREDELTESGSSVATPADRDMLTTSPKGLSVMMKGLDEKTIQEILQCCCCLPEIQQNPSGWDPSQHASHQHIAQHAHFPSPSNPLVFPPLDASSPFLPNHHLSPAFPQQSHDQQQQSFAQNFHLPSLAGLLPFGCKWSDCTLTFGTRDLLVSHVNTEHLSVSPPTSSKSPSSTAFDLAALGLKLDAGLAAGIWDPSPSTAPSDQASPFDTPEPSGSASMATTPAKGQGDDKLAAATSTLQHLLQEHLAKLDPSVALALTSSLANAAKGTSTEPHAHPHPHSHPHSHSHAHPHRHRGHVHHAHPYGVHPRTSGSSTPLPAPLPSSSGTHLCRWKNCKLTFETSAELMTHLSLEHVGSGKASYGCEWEGCERASDAPGGGRGFAQRQKVMRHLQTHTGDRPFVCEVCNKSFSEAMTLTQHMRVHTNERPYKCTYDGCEKAFSLASALTIHLRTHTGDKPFHCPYPGCTSAFSESSNLSKHVRTHKGEKSYACEECGKAFSRSDQLARHRKIHAKARGEEV